MKPKANTILNICIASCFSSLVAMDNEDAIDFAPRPLLYEVERYGSLPTIHEDDGEIYFVTRSHSVGLPLDEQRRRDELKWRERESRSEANLMNLIHGECSGSPSNGRSVLSPLNVRRNSSDSQIALPLTGHASPIVRRFVADGYEGSSLSSESTTELPIIVEEEGEVDRVSGKERVHLLTGTVASLAIRTRRPAPSAR